MPRHRWSALYAPEDPPILAAVSSRSWGWSGRPRFHGDDQSRLGSSWLVPAAKAKAPLAQEQLFLPRRARGVAAGPALDNDHPFVRLLDVGIKKASPPEGRRLALTSHPFVTGRSLVFETRPFALLPWRKATWSLREHGLDLSFLKSRRATTRAQRPVHRDFAGGRNVGGQAHRCDVERGINSCPFSLGSLRPAQGEDFGAKGGLQSLSSVQLTALK